jgi:hypothetical protein
MSDYSYDLLHVEIADGVARTTTDHPPINLLDVELRFKEALDAAVSDLR